MSSAESFLKSLKVIGFPQVNAYTSADFEPLFLDQELKPILECICDLNEDNVLTSEELAEYAALSPTELAYYEKLAETENLLDSDECKNEEGEEVKYLEDYLALVTEETNLLQKQKDSLKLHENILLDEKEKYETMLLNAQKQLEIYKVHTVPEAEAELTSSLCSVVNVISELEALITDPGGDSKILASVQKDVDSYFDDEKTILKHIKQFLEKHLEVGDDGNFSSKISGYSQSNLLMREVHFLKNILINCKNEEFSIVSEKVKTEAIIKFFERYEDECFPHIFRTSASQLWSKLAEESKFNKELKETEKLIKLRLSNAIFEHVKGLCFEIGITHSQEIVHCFNRNYKKIQAPLKHLLSQRSRLELIVLYLNAYKQSFENVKYLCESTSNFIKKEKTIMCNIKNMSEEQSVQEPVRQNDLLCDDSTLLTIYKILNDIKDQELCFVSHEEVLKRIKKLFEDQVHFKELQDEKLHHLHLMEEQIAGLEKYVFKGKQFSKFLEADASLNISLNKLDLKFSHFTKILGDIEADLNEKEKMLKRNENLQLARHLYIDAFLDPEHYKEQIKNIKDAYENILDSSLNQSIP